jgi:hypothetical protein
MGLPPLAPGLPPGRLTGHVELVRRCPETGDFVEVATSRPCELCGRSLQALDGPLAEAAPDERAHASCRAALRGCFFRG